MVDKIKPLKIESTVGGGNDNNLFPTETDPSQDYASLKGISFTGADNRLIDLNGSGQLQMTDSRVTNHLIPRTASEVDFSNATNGFDSTNSQTAIEEIDFRTVVLEPTGFLNRTSSTISFSNSSKLFTITPIGSFSYYIRGHKYTKSVAESVAITANEGLWYIYYNGANLTASQTPWNFDDPVAFVAFLYWDNDNSVASIFGEERHGLVMDWATHQRMHKTDGSQVEYGTFTAGNYIIGGNGSLNSHAQLSLTDGRIYDEDLILSVTNSATPTNPFEQKLSTVAYIPIYYKSGASGVWRKLTATAFPVAYQTGSTIRYNKVTAGSWGLTNAVDGNIVASWIFATNNIYEPIICILGQMESSNLSAASSDDFFSKLDLTGFPFLEYKLLYRAFFKTQLSYTNTPKAILASIDGLRIPNIVPSPVVNYNIISSTPFSTSSTTDVVITGFSFIPQSGTYGIWFNSDATATQNNSVCSHTIYYNGVAVTDSIRRTQTVSSSFIFQETTMTILQVDGTKTVDVRVSTSQGTLTINGRSLLVVRLGA